MKIVSRILGFGILPLCTIILFVSIGKLNEQIIYAKEGDHHTMTGGISAIAWTNRGIYAAILIIVVSFILFSKLSKKVKIFEVVLILMMNLPFIYFAEYLFFFPLLLLAIPVSNLIVFAPIFAVLTVNQTRYKENEYSDKLE